MTDDLERLRAVLHEMGGVLVTFSGGVDSALLLKVAFDELGARAVALTATSATLPPEEEAVARGVARLVGVRHLLVDSAELEREGYARNAGNRCYFCKTELYALARDRARALDLPWVADGTILDDLSGHRPGLQAADEAGVRHPLVEAGLTKARVREHARALGLPVWDKPSVACLGSRFAVGTRVTLPRVLRVARVEAEVRRLGFRVFRVRVHDLGEGAELARVELGADELDRLGHADVRAALQAAGRREGFAFVTIDLAGYRSGSTSLRPSPTP